MDYSTRHESQRSYFDIPWWEPPIWTMGAIHLDLSNARSYASLQSLAKAENALWTDPFRDAFFDHYAQKESLMVQLLSDTVLFSLDGFATAVDSVRVRCPAVQSIESWNELRASLSQEMFGLRDTTLVSLAALSAIDISDFDAERIAAYAYFAGMAPISTGNDLRRLCAQHRRVPLEDDGALGGFPSSLTPTLDFYCQRDMLEYILR